MRGPFLAACIAAVLYGIAVGVGVGVRNAPASTWDSEFAEWLDAVGSAGAALAAVWLGYIAIARSGRDRSSKARIVAYVLVDEFAKVLVSMNLLASDGRDEEEYISRRMTIIDENLWKEFVANIATASMQRTQEEFQNLPDLPGELGFHVASYIPFTKRLYELLEYGNELGQADRVQLYEQMQERVRTVLPNCIAVYDALVALAEGNEPSSELGSRAPTVF